MESLKISRFELTQSDSDVMLRPDGKRALHLTTDGETRDVTWWDAGQLKTKAEWKDGQLRVERRVSRIKILDVYTRFKESTRLIVTTTIEGMPRGGTFRRVFDQVES